MKNKLLLFLFSLLLVAHTAFGKSPASAAIKKTPTTSHASIASSSNQDNDSQLNILHGIRQSSIRLSENHRPGFQHTKNNKRAFFQHSVLLVRNFSSATSWQLLPGSCLCRSASPLYIRHRRLII